MSPPKKRATNSSRAKYLKQRAISTSLITGPGLFFTCPRNKEAAAVYEFKDLLERVAEEIKPVETDEEQLQADDTEDLDEEPENNADDTDDIASQIRKELEELKGGKRSGDQGPKKQRSRGFESKKMECECLGFISFPKAYDPVVFAAHIVRQIQQGTPGYGLKYIQRITPVSMTCSANSPAEFEKMVTTLLRPRFGIKARPEPKQVGGETGAHSAAPEAHSTICPRVGLKFRIESIVRCHDRPLNRTEVIRITGDVVKRFNGDEYIVVDDDCLLNQQPHELQHRVSIDDAQVVILISVYRYVAGVSVVENYDKDGKRFNLRTLAEAQEKKASDPPADPHVKKASGTNDGDDESQP
ncbi:hypothetical protein PCANC_04285 [Puccinia coronata f. sp. avenae]|uniref:THUMP domain-containing protein n=1 Tax=Puccinia coronata f. sp. avenae TaxID=200324 RepID=A0A2N5SPU3_9BASI|nr:hypothetical protein PCANC_18520 [Puccinia coronata f. sp. avenae]PLW53626.1 hypothetical protein PCANC_04285 [Puccinia coronata f. sp. avenae]